MTKNFFVILIACCFAVSISAKVWKTNSGKSPHVFLDVSVDDFNKDCDAKRKSVSDRKIFAPYFKRYKEIQEEVLKKVKADPKTNVEDMITNECVKHHELKKQIETVIDTLELCLVETDRLEKAMKDKMIQEILEIKCANLMKAVIIRSEEKCLKKEPPLCLETLDKIQDLLFPVPFKYTPQLCGEIQKLLQCKMAMKDCKEVTKKALESFVSEEMSFYGCPAVVA